ncbi:MAG: RNA-binding protein [Candidatus Moranbacteria bacterium CG_4_10_14_3_um_filter_41_65]|nr:MAG: RNA-binding protein [Candidatus Moranbacteria bacterium CG23_combo_of_CG06-09_8_20_14_all_41_28]PIV85968.1 MAG: RNA-binding protein [Candidatus Moranbacteria bacterium CG17_big_fil_post_rev_8_21_14_2_50_41_107]PIW94320.1 MAG: RNA-binding protein [Candidatus Moranbacteria bacterium CG_4_8_14_3_um_filter_41_13]PIX91638.1 MAG: RNA-binding protein [Candidatus Moranbacteria bacterium CG_4_10_14_3_um_filter_41_65]PJB99925.1 MAG: RNA-binding protein [Candidatus Moranbacteria bacterium CG_4_9_1
MATKLYVGGVSYGSTEDALQAAFAQAGNVVSAKIIIDKMTGRSRGFAFVEMATEDDAQKAIALWNGKELDGRTLTVNEARPMEERAPRTGGNRSYNNGGSNDQGASRW